MIFVEPMLGLCNRIRVLDSVLAINHARRHSVCVLWVRNADLNCRFDELFERPAGVDRIFDFAGATQPGRFLKQFLPRLVQNAVARAIDQKEMDSLRAAGFSFAELVKTRSLYLRTWEHFHRGEDPLAAFQLVPELRAIVDAHQINRPQTVGVHIRRTDHRWLHHSPTNEFVSLMEQEAARRPGVVFFVATDDLDEEKNLQQRFPGRIITHPKRSLDRNSSAAIKDAAIDLYSLARCGKIIGSYGSSFSIAAAQIGGSEFITAEKPVSPTT